MSNRRTLVTGAGGFIGTHLCQRLVADGVDTLAMDSVHPPRHGTPVIGSVLIPEDLDKCGGHGPKGGVFDIVYHLAAFVGPQRVDTHPWITLLENGTGTQQVLSHFWNTDVLLTSSSEVYGHQEECHEDDSIIIHNPTHPRQAYSISKLAAEQLTLARFGIVARLFNVTGPGQSQDYVLPRFVQQALRGQPITVYGNGLQTRSFIHVRDVVEAFLVLERSRPHTLGQVYNIGKPSTITIIELAEMVRQYVASVDIEMVDTPGWDSGIQRRRPNIDKMKPLGWQPKISLKETILQVAKYEESKLC